MSVAVVTGSAGLIGSETVQFLSGKGFAVVANEVKSLAEATRQATHSIGDTVRDLDGQVRNLISESGDASVRAKSAGDGATQIQDIIVRVQSGFTSVGQEIDSVARAATSNLSHCDMVISELGVFSVDKTGAVGVTLIQLADGVTVDEVKAKTKAKLSINV